VVDDDRMVRQILMEALAFPRCYLLEEAANASRPRSAWDLSTRFAHPGRFMPEMDGLEGVPAHPGRARPGRHEGHHHHGFPGHPKLDELAALGFTHGPGQPFDIPVLLRMARELLDPPECKRAGQWIARPRSVGWRPTFPERRSTPCGIRG